MIGVIVPELTHHFYSQIISGIDSVLDSDAYQHIICLSNESYEKERKAARALHKLRVDGVLIAPAIESTRFDHFQEFISSDIPLVFLDRICEDITAPYVISDDFNGAIKGTEYLLERGCRHIAYIKGPENISTTFSRFMGYLEALKKNGIMADPNLVIQSDGTAGLPEKITELVQTHSVDAFFCHSDYHAFCALTTVLKMGLRVPEDISILGYADEPIATHTTPQLSTVRQPAFEIGVKGMELLIYEMLEKEKMEPALLDVELIIRESTR